MSVLSSVKYVRVGGSMVVKPISARVSGAWNVVQGVANAPTTILSDPGDTLATVSWTVPTNTGKLPITGYTVTSSPGNITATSSSPNATVTGLSNGVSYTFTVKANNAVGSGTASVASSAVMPAPLTGELYVSPSSGSYAVGATITVTIHEQSLTEAVNSVGAKLTYDPTLLQYVSSNVTGSPFDTAVQNSGGSGTVQIGSFNSSGSTTGDQLVATIAFTALAAGGAGLIFVTGPDSGIARASDSTDICNEKLGASFVIS